jgi:hypothetical protein
MIDVREAALKAFAYVADMETVANAETTPEEFLASSDVAVESARHDVDQGAWVIGVGFVRSWGRVKSTVAIVMGHPEGLGTRTIKRVVVSDETGEVLEYE